MQAKDFFFGYESLDPKGKKKIDGMMRTRFEKSQAPAEKEEGGEEEQEATSEERDIEIEAIKLKQSPKKRVKQIATKVL